MSRISDVEVINFLKTALQLKVTREQLMKPTTEFIILIYGRFLNEFNIDKLNQPDLMSCSTFSNIEYMEKTIFYINITNAISKLLSKIGFEDITLQDIITPKRNRTMAIISGLCSCLINYINVKNEWLKHMESSINISQQKQQIESKLVELRHNVEEKHMLLSSLKNKTVGMDKQYSELNECLIKKHSEAKTQADESKEIKFNNLTLREQLSEIDLTISQLKEKQQELRQTIIRSPMKMINGKNDQEKKLLKLKEEIVVIKNNCTINNKNVNNYKISIDLMKQIAKEINDSFQLLNKINEKSVELETFNKDDFDCDKEIKKIEIQLEGINSSKEQLKTQKNKENAYFLQEQSVLMELLNGLQEKVKMIEDLEQRSENAKNGCEQRIRELEIERNEIDHVFDRFDKRLNYAIEQFRKIVNNNVKDTVELMAR